VCGLPDLRRLVNRLCKRLNTQYRPDPNTTLQGRPRVGQLTVCIGARSVLYTCGIGWPLRVEYPGAVYHVMARGHERAAIPGDRDREKFLFVARVPGDD
jgi:hypothetical protein